ncbi:rhomboid-like protein [Nocardia pseudovaccinii]|uniref:rhomboid-like protein n=1 Tax=Nocardia pseudovaccinii TaxID=189540 RepID=UPI000A3F651D|nr:rhomboid-like protein [Nocardia pseudovaccinii]
MRMEVLMVAATTTADRAPVDPLRPLRSRWWQLRLPATFGYLVALVAVTAVFSAMSETSQARVVLHASTNLHNLLNGRVGTVLSSALVIGDVSAAWVLIPLLGCLLALAELRFGAVHMVRVFLAGHIGATLLVAAGLWIAIEADWLPASIRWAQDVGVSYGAMALVGAIVVAIPHRWRIAWSTVWFIVAAEGVLIEQTFTNVGHLLAFCIGTGVGFGMLRAKAASTRRLTRIESGLLAVSAFLAAILLMG